MSKDVKRFIKLGWTLLEAKYFYYNDPENENTREDTWYDTIEDEYKALSIKLDIPATVYEKVGFPTNSPSGQMVATRCTEDNFKYTIER